MVVGPSALAISLSTALTQLHEGVLGGRRGNRLDMVLIKIFICCKELPFGVEQRDFWREKEQH